MGNNSIYEMIILGKNNFPVEESTDCKEEMGEIMVADGLNSFVIDVEERFTNTEINGLLRRMHTHERSVGIKRKTEVRRVKDYDDYLYVQFSPQWNYNSVANSLYMTWFRKKISQILGNSTYTDDDHLDSAKWLVKLVKDRGLGILGRYRHKRYRGGMVRICVSMERGCFWWLKDTTCFKRPYSTMSKLYWKDFPESKRTWRENPPSRYDY